MVATSTRGHGASRKIINGGIARAKHEIAWRKTRGAGVAWLRVDIRRG